jgi:hypothetical protein
VVDRGGDRGLDADRGSSSFAPVAADCALPEAPSLERTMKTPARHAALSLLVVFGACAKTSGPCVGAGCVDTDSDVPADSDETDIVIDTDSSGAVHTDETDVVHTDETDVAHTDETDVAHTDETDVAHTDETDVVHTDTGMQTCVGPLSDWATWGTAENVLEDFASLETYNAWQCSEDLTAATTCPRYASTCVDSLGEPFTVVLLHAGTKIAYVLFADDGTLAALYVRTDAPDYCGETSYDLWLGREIVGCFFDPFGSPECGTPLTCSSPNP